MSRDYSNFLIYSMGMNSVPLEVAITRANRYGVLQLKALLIQLYGTPDIF